MTNQKWRDNLELVVEQNLNELIKENNLQCDICGNSYIPPDDDLCVYNDIELID